MTRTPTPYAEGDGWCLYCGDCRAVLPTLAGVDAVVTDPPYGMAFRSNHRIDRHADIDGDEDAGLLRLACGIPARHSRYVFCRWNNLRDIPEPASLITWVKNNWSMGDLDHEHARQTEVVAFYPGPDHVWPGPRPKDVVFHPRSGNELHPTEKTESLMREIVSWTLEGCTVFDPFCGSGTTGVACRQLGRRFIGIEIDEGYCAVAARRIAAALNPQTWRDPRTIDSPLFATEGTA